MADLTCRLRSVPGGYQLPCRGGAQKGSLGARRRKKHPPTTRHAPLAIRAAASGYPWGRREGYTNPLVPSADAPKRLRAGPGHRGARCEGGAVAGRRRVVLPAVPRGQKKNALGSLGRPPRKSLANHYLARAGWPGPGRVAVPTRPSTPSRPPSGTGDGETDPSATAISGLRIIRDQQLGRRNCPSPSSACPAALLPLPWLACRRAGFLLLVGLASCGTGLDTLHPSTHVVSRDVGGKYLRARSGVSHHRRQAFRHRRCPTAETHPAAPKSLGLVSAR